MDNSGDWFDVVICDGSHQRSAMTPKPQWMIIHTSFVFGGLSGPRGEPGDIVGVTGECHFMVSME